MSITNEHLEFYKEHGYVVLEGIMSDDDLDSVIQDYIAIVDDKAHAMHAQGMRNSFCRSLPQKRW